MVNVISGVVDGIGKRSVLRRIPIGSIFVRRLAKRLAGQPVTVRTVQRTEKTEKAPQLYDLTALQREANRSLGYTAQQTLDYLQALYEKKLCTYPRTDSRFLTDDLETSVPELAAVAAVICEAAVPGRVNAGQVCDSKKVSDHHAILPTAGAGKADVSVLPLGERELLRLVAGQLLRAVSYAVPKSCVSVREPFSDERRRAASERAKNAGYTPPARSIYSENE